MCNHDPATVIWAHANWDCAGKGKGLKVPDILGAMCCFSCHSVIDRLVPRPKHYTPDDIKLMFWEGHARSVLRLIEKGLIVTERGKVAA